MKEYIKKNNTVMLIVISAILMGIIIGAHSAARLAPGEAKGIYESINRSVYESTAYKAFIKSLQIEFKSFILLFICGAAVIGAPAAVFYLGFLGYALGFSVGFLVKYYGLLGFFAATCAIVPHYLILIPAFISLGVISINFSNKLLLGERGLKDDFWCYAVKALLIAAAVFSACIIEGFFSSFILKRILSVIILKN
ncbi:MAG: stage II sporulation protein M [Clostridia bacterium]|nr:stage II sporulation protein M [Clostridia bacterium]